MLYTESRKCSYLETLEIQEKPTWARVLHYNLYYEYTTILGMLEGPKDVRAG